MASLKRSAEQISDQGDTSEEECLNLSKIRCRREKRDLDRASSTETPSKYANFTEFLANNLPTALIPAEAKNIIIFESNARLERARKEGVDFASISIGEDCLPVWPGFSWDPSAESLHSAIQGRVTAFQNAKELGSLFRTDLIAKSNRRLDEARQQDMPLESIVIGDSVLPEWEDDNRNQTPGGSSQTAIIIDDESDGSESDEVTKLDSVDINTSSTSVVEEIIEIADLDSDLSHSLDSSASPDISDYQYGYDRTPSCFHDSEFLETFIADQFDPYNLGRPHNIVHGAQLVNDSRIQSVDLEVFVACDDEDDYGYHHLPEVELAVCRGAYEYWYETEEAVDFEFPGMQVLCTGELFSIEEVDEDDELHAMYTSGQLLFNPVPSIEEAKDYMPADNAAVDASSPSTIVESEDGFRW